MSGREQKRFRVEKILCVLPLRINLRLSRGKAKFTRKIGSTARIGSEVLPAGWEKHISRSASAATQIALICVYT